MGYRDFVRFMQDSEFIVSDSGTAQEEPALLNIPVIVPRDVTERPESVENNNSIMLDLQDQACYNKAINWVTADRNSSTKWLGDGNTSRKILEILKNEK
jgi:UDP-N-acetylglucosamine 2-epimerase (non-hydrolysing)